MLFAHLELAYLPGGIHACCLSTILDPTEVTLVTVAATNLFLKLLQHRSNDGSLHTSVAPMCKEKVSSKTNPVTLLFAIADQQQFFQQVLTSIDYFAVSDTFDADQSLRITNCGTIACYASIISTLFELNKSMFTHLIETRTLILLIE
jgi:rotatin